VDPSDNHHPFYLIDKGIDRVPPGNYEKVSLPTRKYNLYRLMNIKNVEEANGKMLP